MRNKRVEDVDYATQGECFVESDERLSTLETALEKLGTSLEKRQSFKEAFRQNTYLLALAFLTGRISEVETLEKHIENVQEALRKLTSPRLAENAEQLEGNEASSRRFGPANAAEQSVNASETQESDSELSDAETTEDVEGETLIEHERPERKSTTIVDI